MKKQAKPPDSQGPTPSEDRRRALLELSPDERRELIFLIRGLGMDRIREELELDEEEQP